MHSSQSAATAHGLHAGPSNQPAVISNLSITMLEPAVVVSSCINNGSNNNRDFSCTCAFHVLTTHFWKSLAVQAKLDEPAVL